VPALGFAVAVFAGVMTRGFVVMVLRVEMVTVRYVRMVRGLQVIAALVMLGRLLVMVRGMPAVLGGVAVMVGGSLVIGHFRHFLFVGERWAFVARGGDPLER
jgi:hypothetical protein